MDDFNIEDPRKTSAKQIKKTIEDQKDKKTILQYLFDLIFKTILCEALVLFDFVLFTNSGNYKFFSYGMELTPEIRNIIMGITAIVVIIMFLASFINKLDNLILSILCGGVFVAIINQFATFDKQSGLLIIFGGIFSDKINAILYEYSLWIIFALISLFSLYVFNKLKRQYIFYITFIACSMVGWLISEAYFNNESKYFRNIENKKTGIPSNDEDENFIYLSFKGLGSTNVLNNISETIKNNSSMENSFYNLLGFYTNNNFTLYPNTTTDNFFNPFVNLALSYNPDFEGKKEDLLLNNASKTSYFDFSSLQQNKFHLKSSSVMEKLAKENYQINIYQTRDIDMCQAGKNIENFSCNEKISIPLNMSDTLLSDMEKTKLLLSQWLQSTGYIPSLNTVLNTINFVWSNDFTKPLKFDPSELYAINSLKIFDIIIQDINDNKGKKAYFVGLDFPSSTYMYDDFCNLKPLDKWSSEHSVSGANIALSKRQEDYSQQLNCLVGILNNFIEKLKNNKQLNTTIIIEGLSNPLGISPKNKELYKNIQAEKQISLAIHKLSENSSFIDYSLCPVNNVLSSFFFDTPGCNDIKHLTSSNDERNKILSESDFQKYSLQKMQNATSKFINWYPIWKANQDTTKTKPKPENKNNVLSLNKEMKPKIKEIKKAVITDKIVEDTPESKLPSISVAMDKTEINEEEKPIADLEDFEAREKAKLAANKQKLQQATETPAAPESAEEATTETEATETPAAPKSAEEAAPETEATGNTNNSNQAKIADIEKELEEISSNTKQTNATEISEDVVPETLFDENSRADKIEESINKAKQLIKEKEVTETEDQPQQPTQTEEMRNILEASSTIEEVVETQNPAPKTNDITIQLNIVEN